MPNKMLIDASHPEETRVVVVRGNRIEEFDFESQDKKQLKGNIYLARVTRVEPSLQAAFVEYGGNRHGFLAFSEIHPDYYQIPVADRQALLRAEADEAEDEEDEDGDDRNRGNRRRRRGGKNRDRGDSPARSAEGSDDASASGEDHGELTHRTIIRQKSPVRSIPLKSNRSSTMPRTITPPTTVTPRMKSIHPGWKSVTRNRRMIRNRKAKVQHR